MRMRRTAWTLDNPPYLGLVTTFAIDPARTWLAVGTARGCVAIWDLRFHLRVKTWRHPSKSKIDDMLIYRSPFFSSWLFISDGSNNEVSAWDVENNVCRLLFQVVGVGQNPEKIMHHPEALNPPESDDFATDDIRNPLAQKESKGESIRSILCPPTCSYMFTAGSDRRIRYWDFNSFEKSFTMCGIPPDADPVINSYRKIDKDDLTVYQEIQTATVDKTATMSSSGNLGSINKKQAQGMPSPLIAHNDCILNLKVLEQPSRMLISGSRDGVIKVWK